jgi:hypothetical protein
MHGNTSHIFMHGSISHIYIEFLYVYMDFLCIKMVHQ